MVNTDEGFWSIGVQSCSFSERQMLDLIGHHLRLYYEHLLDLPVPERLEELSRQITQQVPTHPLSSQPHPLLRPSDHRPGDGCGARLLERGRSGQPFPAVQALGIDG